tara:strand:+ start:1812 stop:2468 length:657 start_codon:yes stop_codon:yes gene_type:complete
MTDWQNRIVGTGSEDPTQLLGNPLNWRIHPRHQQEAMTGVLDEIGWVQNIIVNQRTSRVIDGHMRVEVAITEGASEVPVVYVDLSDEEERTILATYDPIAAMAVSDSEKMSELLADIRANSVGVQELLEDMRDKHTPLAEMASSGSTLSDIFSQNDVDAMSEAIANTRAPNVGQFYFTDEDWDLLRRTLNKMRQEDPTLETSADALMRCVRYWVENHD